MIIEALCRVCLSSYSKMHQIANTEYQELFEKLSTKLSTADQRPETVCYICFSHLQRCRRFVEMSRKAEEILTHFSLNGIQATYETLAEHTLNMKEHLSLSPMKYLFIGDIGDGSQAAIKEEVIPVKEEVVSVKEEVISVNEEVIPVKDEVVSVKEEVVSVKEEVISVKEEVIPVKDEVVFVKEEVISVKEEVAEAELWVEIEDGGILFKDGNDVSTELSKMDVEQTKLKTAHCGDSCSKTLSETSEVALHTQLSNSRHLPFGCNWCEKKFSRKANLAIHERVHTGKKTYACAICDKCFFDISGLIKHKRVHSGERPFPCNLCGKKFTQKIVLTKHMKVHTEERPHACKVCKKEFKHEYSLTKHIRRFHTREMPYARDIMWDSISSKI